jgi:outer membrane protein assembly factor BamB
LAADTWPAFRNTGDSHTAARDLPLTWSDTENVAWRTPVAGEGQSSPVVWKADAFVTSIEGPDKETLHLTCVDLASGKVRWRWKRAATTRTKNSDMTSKAAPTPAVDDKRLYAFYESGDLIAFDHDGGVLWQRALTDDYGKFDTNHGLGGSVVQLDDRLFILVAQNQNAYLLAIDAATGKTIWKADRAYGASWTTPVIVRDDAAGPLVVVSSNGVVEGLSPADGKSVWTVTGLKGNTVASPSADGQAVLIGSGQLGPQLAIKLGGRGDVSATHVMWQTPGVDCSFGSPVILGGHAYFTNKVGVAYCLEVATGKVRWKERLSASCWASPFAAGDRIYFPCTDGQTTAVKADPAAFDKLADNKLTVQGRVVGVAAVDRAILLRTPTELVFIGRPATK